MSVPFQIFVRNLQNNSLVLGISPLDSIQKIKGYIQEREGIPAHLQRLVFQGKELRDQCCVQEAQIKKSDTLYLTMALKGGGNSKSTFNIKSKYMYSAHSTAPCSLVVSGDGKHIVSGCADGTVTVFNVETRKTTTEHLHRGELATVAMTDDKKYIASSAYSRKESLKVTDFTLKNCIQEYSDTFATSIAFTKNNKHIICGTSDGSVKIFSMSNPKCIYTFKKLLPDCAVMSIIIRDNLAIIGTQTIKILSLANCKCVRIFEDISPLTKKIVAVSNKLKYIAQAGYDRYINVFSFLSGKCIRRIKNLDDHLIESIAISKNNRFLIVLNSISVVKFIDITYGRCMFEFSKESTLYADFPLMRLTDDNQNLIIADWKGDVKVLTIMSQ